MSNSIQTLASENTENLEKILDASQEKQNKLIAGSNITISDDNVISADVPTKTSELENDSDYLTQAVAANTYQEKLEYYSEDTSTAQAQMLVAFDNGNQAGLTVNGTTVGIASAGVPILIASVNADTTIQAIVGDVHLRTTGTGKKAYYNDSEIITEQSLSDKLDTKQDKLQCYYEDSNGAHTDAQAVSISGDGDIVIKSGSVSVTISGSSGIALDSGDVKLNLSGDASLNGSDWILRSSNVRDVILVDELPSTPVSSALYLIPE